MPNTAEFAVNIQAEAEMYLTVYQNAEMLMDVYNDVGIAALVAGLPSGDSEVPGMFGLTKDEVLNFIGTLGYIANAGHRTNANIIADVDMTASV